MSDIEAPTKDELKQIGKWFEENKALVPQPIGAMIVRLLACYMSLSQSKAKAKQVLLRLREAMGILPKSERGKSDKPKPFPEASQGELQTMSPEERAQYEAIQKKRRDALSAAAEYKADLRKLRPPPKNPEQLELAIDDALERVFSSPSSVGKIEAEKEKVDRMQEFGRKEGLHSTYDSTTRIDLKVLVTTINYEIETVTDPMTGKSVRASMEHVGPEGWQLTWQAICTLIKLTVGFAIPINRVALLIGRPEFTSGKICRVLQWAATLVLPIYMHLFDEVAEAGILSGDDTKTKILDLGEAGEDSISRQIDEHLGWTWPKADGTGDKTAMNVSLLIGRSEKMDPASTICFYRTHQGSVGNLLTRLLEWRTPKAGPVIFQGDLSTTNLPSEELRRKFDFTVAGCGAHARRPFWRYRDEDAVFCYFMLRGFLLLSRVENLIDAKGRTQATVLKLRNHYSRKIWQALHNRCVTAISGRCPGRFTIRKDASPPDLWVPDSELYIAAKYVINHFKALTLYLDNPFLKYTNNAVERALRIEKCLLSSSKFTKTRNGRAAIDILRTINTTCTAARIELTVYLRYIFKHRDQLHTTPEMFTPYAVAKHLEAEKNAASKNT